MAPLYDKAGVLMRTIIRINRNDHAVLNLNLGRDVVA